MGEGTGARQVRGWNWNTLSLSDPDELSWLAAIRSSDHDGIIILSWTMSLRHQREIIDWLSRFPSLEWDSCGLREDKQCQHIFPHYYYSKWTNILRMCSDIKSLEEVNKDEHFQHILAHVLFITWSGQARGAYFIFSPHQSRQHPKFNKIMKSWPHHDVDYNSDVKGRNIAVKGKKGVEIGGTKKFSKVTWGWQGGSKQIYWKYKTQNEEKARKKFSKAIIYWINVWREKDSMARCKRKYLRVKESSTTTTTDINNSI